MRRRTRLVTFQPPQGSHVMRFSTCLAAPAAACPAARKTAARKTPGCPTATDSGFMAGHDAHNSSCECSLTVNADACCHQADTYDMARNIQLGNRDVCLSQAVPSIKAHLEKDPLVLRVRVDALRLEEVCLGAHLVRRVQVVLICDAATTSVEGHRHSYFVRTMRGQYMWANCCFGKRCGTVYCALMLLCCTDAQCSRSWSLALKLCQLWPYRDRGCHLGLLTGPV